MRTFSYSKLYMVLFMPLMAAAPAAQAADTETTSMIGTLTGVSGDGSVIVGSGKPSDNSVENQVFRFENGNKVWLGTLKADNTGYSKAYAVSADGRVAVGEADTDSGDIQAFRHNKGDTRMTGLGTLKTDNSGDSAANAASADGRVVVGWAATDAGDRQAFRHNEGDARVTGLGTLKTDNTGESSAYAVSADGRVVVGDADTDSGDKQAFRHNAGDARVTSLGTLKADNSGTSLATAVSADGRVVVGMAETDGDTQAFRHNEGDARMTGLGTLATDNSGVSEAVAVSADGRVVVGSAQTDSGDAQAFRHNAGDARMTGLGTLKADNSGVSQASAVSADGRVVVGQADTESGKTNAFYHKEGDEKMTGLGTLKADNSGNSLATGVSGDGRVVIGASDTDEGQTHATIWRIAGSDSKAVDVDNSRRAMFTTAQRSDRVLSLYQSQLNQLSQTRCDLRADSACLGVLTSVTGTSAQTLTAAGLTGAVRLPGEHVSLGATVQMPVSTRFMDNYETRGNRTPSAGAWLRYDQQVNGEGFGVTLAGSLIKQDVTITRDQLSGTERGRGASSVDGVQARLAADYSIHAGDTLLRPEVSLSWSDITRDGYTEYNDIDFPAVYGKTGLRQTDLGLALNASRPLNDIFTVHGGAGADISLDSQREAFTGQIDYIGALTQRDADHVNVRPYVTAGLKAELTDSSEANLTAGWMKTSWGYDSVNAMLSYTYRF